MTKADFKNETFGYAKRGELGFRSGAVYGKEYKDVHERTAFLKKCFDYYVFSEGEKVKLSFKKDSKNVLARLWKNSKDLKDFRKLIIEDKEARLMQFTGEWLATTGCPASACTSSTTVPVPFPRHRPR